MVKTVLSCSESSTGCNKLLKGISGVFGPSWYALTSCLCHEGHIFKHIQVVDVSPWHLSLIRAVCVRCGKVVGSINVSWSLSKAAFKLSEVILFASCLAIYKNVACKTLLE